MTLGKLVNRAVLGVLGRRRAAILKQILTPTGTLDYPRAHIEMVLDSEAQVRRLAACAKEPETVAWLEAHMRPGDVFYDIGANVGAYSFVADAITGGRSRTYSFEPSFSTFHALCQNIVLNRAGDRMTPLYIALAGKTGVLRLHYASTIAGAALHQLGDPGALAAEYSQDLLCFRLDELVRQFGLAPPTVLKLDIDGGEMDALTGAGDLLSAPTLRTLLVEIDDAEQGGAAAPILALLERHGLRVTERTQRRSSHIFNYVFQR